MSGSLITLPWRVGARSVGLAWRGTTAVVDRATSLVTDTLGHAPPRDEDLDGAPSGPAAEAPEAAAPPAPSAPAEPSEAAEPSAPAAPAPEPEPLPDLEEPEPSHVSEESVLVEEVAEPGAEDGAGAQVTVEEPWEGYRALNADAVIERLAEATPAELAAVELYELTHRKRQTVVEAAADALKRRS